MQYENELETITNKSQSVRYVLHRDVANNRWNVFKKTGLYEEYETFFDELKDAQTYCDQKNGISGS